MKIVADQHIPFVTNYFGTYGELLLKAGRTISHADVVDADILLVRSVTHVDEKLLAGTSVKFVGSVTAGADHLDSQWLEATNMAWSVADGFNAQPVADYVISIVAALQKQRLLKTKHTKAAVIGVGHAGRLVAEHLKLLNFDVVLCDPLRAESEDHFSSVALNALSDMDFISLHVPLTRSGSHPTYHFIDKNFLQRQKPSCILVNASRGAVINTHDLMHYGTHLHWCFDVWENEPQIDKHVLKQTLIATPHIAGYSVQSKIRGIDMIYRAACKKKIIKAMRKPPLTLPQQKLSFARETQCWQDIVLGIFNPLLLTEIMCSRLLSCQDHGHLFDELRDQFNYRYEFAYTKVTGAMLPAEDREILKMLKITIL